MLLPVIKIISAKNGLRKSKNKTIVLRARREAERTPKIRCRKADCRRVRHKFTFFPSFLLFFFFTFASPEYTK